MKTILIGSVAAVGLIASTAMAEPLKLGDAQLTNVTAGLLDGSNLAFVKVFNANFGDQIGGGRPHNGNGGCCDVDGPTIVPVTTSNGDGGGDTGNYFGSVHIDLWQSIAPPMRGGG